MIKYIIKNDSDEPIYDANTAANFINNYFVNVGPKQAQAFQTQLKFFGMQTPFSLDDFCKLINSNKSPAIDNLSSKILKVAFCTLIIQFIYIINLTFQKSKIPDKRKTATVTPLFKTGDTFRCCSYRPISQLPLPGKIVEKIVHKKMSEFF